MLKRMVEVQFGMLGQMCVLHTDSPLPIRYVTCISSLSFHCKAGVLTLKTSNSITVCPRF